MNVIQSDIPGVLLIEPHVFKDSRGLFVETYQHNRYKQHGMPGVFLQDNQSRSVRGTLRGLHAQCRRPQGKLVNVVRGEIFDVAVDIRRGSPTFGKWVGARLSGDDFRQMYIPPGFAHGFCVLSEISDFAYKCTDLYDASDQISILWSDPDIGIRWPLSNPLLSKKDEKAPRLKDLTDRLPIFEEPSA